MASFADFLAANTREPIVLAELEPSLTVTGWAATGYVHSYSVAFSRFAGADVIAGGMYRPVIGVRRDVTDLTQAGGTVTSGGNIGLAADDTWYFDEANNLLYVRQASAPSGFTMLVFVRLHVASTSIVLDTGIHYKPWLLSDVPTINDDAPDPLIGGTDTTGSPLVVSNAHGFWHKVLATDGDWNWDNKAVRILFGGRYGDLSLTRAQYQDVTTMLVENTGCDEFQAVFSLKPKPRLTDILIPPRVFSSADYANLGQGVEGRAIPIGYGRATLRPLLTDTTVSQGKWTIADAAYQDLKQVHSVVAIAKSGGARTTLTVTTHYTVDLANCTVTVVHASFAHATHDIEVDVTGKTDGGGNAIKTFAPIVQDMLQAFLGVRDAEIDEDAFDNVAATETKELAVWLTTSRQLAAVFASAETNEPSLERSVLGRVQMTGAGLWSVRAFNVGFDPVVGVTLTRADFAEALRGRIESKSIYATATVFYRQNLSTGEYPSQSAMSTRSKYENETEDVISLYTFLRNSSDALTLAQQYEAIAGGPRLFYEFVERGAKLMLSRSSDVVALTYSPAASAAGAFTSEPFIIRHLDRQYSPIPRVSGVLELAASSVEIDPSNVTPMLRYTGTTAAGVPVSGAQNMAVNHVLPFYAGVYTVTVDTDMTVNVMGVAHGGDGATGGTDDGTDGGPGGGGGGGGAGTTGTSFSLLEGKTYTITNLPNAATSVVNMTDVTTHVELNPGTDGSGTSGGNGGALVTGSNGVTGGDGGDGGTDPFGAETAGTDGGNATNGAAGGGGGGHGWKNSNAGDAGDGGDGAETGGDAGDKGNSGGNLPAAPGGNTDSLTNGGQVGNGGLNGGGPGGGAGGGMSFPGVSSNFGQGGGGGGGGTLALPDGTQPGGANTGGSGGPGAPGIVVIYFTSAP